MKINGKKVIGSHFHWDGCHKIYIAESSEDEKQMIGYGFGLLPISKLPDIYRISCPLKFINNWKLTKTYAEQGEEAVFTD